MGQSTWGPTADSLKHSAAKTMWALISQLFRWHQQQLAAFVPFARLHALETNGVYHSKVMRAPSALAAKAQATMSGKDNKYRGSKTCSYWTNKDGTKSGKASFDCY